MQSFSQSPINYSTWNIDITKLTAIYCILYVRVGVNSDLKKCFKGEWNSIIHKYLLNLYLEIEELDREHRQGGGKSARLRGEGGG